MLLLTTILGMACSTHHAITGTITDRNGEPVDKVIIKVEPGNVQLVTDQNGAWTVDYLRDESGERVKLDKRTTYEVEAWKAGYHPATLTVEYKRGELILEPMLLKEDTIRVEGSEEDFDPALFPDRSQSTGATYEGE